MAATEVGAARADTDVFPTAPPAAMPATAAVTAKAGRENFTVASLLLPPAQRRALLGVYGFARLVDDIGDEAPGNRHALLDWLEADLGRMFDGDPIHPLLRRLAPSARRFGFPRGPFLRLIAANRQDQEMSRYRTYDELAAYCDLSANPVGELVLHVFGAATPERVELSDSVCTGLQLVEHWQDVGEDYGRGRVYLPLEDLERFGVEEGALGADQPSPALKQLLAFEVDRARRLLDGGVGLVRSLSGWGRAAVAGYVGGGRATLDAIERTGYDVLRRSPHASGTAKAAATIRALQDAR
jgi:squalene synthase HpnC